MAVHRRDFSIMGTTFLPGAWAHVQKLTPRVMLNVIHEAQNEADKNAVSIWWGGKKLGYAPRGLAAEIAPLIDSGIKFECARSTKKLAGVARPGILAIAWDDGKPEEAKP